MGRREEEKVGEMGRMGRVVSEDVGGDRLEGRVALES
jgi:hypothetical protein